MNLQLLVRTLNKNINSTKIPKTKTTQHASQLCRSYVCSSMATDIFGDFFGRNVYAYTKKLFPIIVLDETPFGFYVSNIQFYNKWEDEKLNEGKIDRLNARFMNLDYPRLSSLPLVDLSDIESIKF